MNRITGLNKSEQNEKNSPIVIADGDLINV